ncbi:MAG: hypothetical protein VKI83_08695 [Synechococcaceae cyanobacterium]|nr:hypothetical protein [Synechococcaceae cyanobacterium]
MPRRHAPIAALGPLFSTLLGSQAWAGGGFNQTINGQEIGAEVADRNSNSLPENDIYLRGAGSGSYGELVACTVINSDRLSPIVLQRLSGAPAKGQPGQGWPAPDLPQAQER